MRSLFLFLAALLPVAASAQQDPQYLQKGVAGIEVARGPNTPASKGSGFVVSIDGDSVFVLTARHILVKDRDRFPGPINVTFFVDKLTAHLATSFAESAAMDLAVLRIDHVPPSLSSLMPAYQIRPDSKPPFLTERLHIFGGQPQQWQVATGEVSDQGDDDYTDRFRFGGRGTRAGFSGAPVMDDSFQLLGIHLGETDGEEAFARAASMSSAYRVLTQRLGIRVLNRLLLGGSPPEKRVLPGDLKSNSKDGLTYVWVPAGSFQMGCSPGDDECWDDEKPAHLVSLAKGFWLAQTPVTVGAWKKYRAATGTPALPPEDSLGRKLNEAAANEGLPAVAATWDEAKGYCEWAGGRLPTEAEWEYAARAGSTAGRYGKLDDLAWYGDNSGRRRLDSTALWKSDSMSYDKKLFENGNGPHPVATKQPNGWKLYDMLGNVWQWTADWYDEKYYTKADSADPHGPPSGQNRALRGGSWNVNPRGVRASNRYGSEPGNRYNDIGVRCVGELFP